MYAIVDIETTGGHASAHGITEVAIVIYNGTEVTHRYQSLVNPQVSIPVYIQSLTGINNDMVANAPLFKDIAADVYKLLQGRIFVAHNVNFDYSFIKYHLQQAGLELQCQKLCTVRLGRKIFAGLPSYSLGKFCRSMGVANDARHRAMGDADATAQLFGMMLKADKDGHIAKALKTRDKEHSLPPNLPLEQVSTLPAAPGVYYFHDQKGKIIYVGKANNLKKRVKSHFTNNRPDQQKQEFMREVHRLTFALCGTELMSFILEAVEIKRLWPKFNRAQKHYEQRYGLFEFEDQNGYLRLAVDKCSKFASPLYTFGTLAEGYNLLLKLVESFELCTRFCFIQKNQHSCPRADSLPCPCQNTETADTYNPRVKQAIAHLKAALFTYAIRDKGRSDDEYSYILMENGEFYGMGYVKQQYADSQLREIKSLITPYPNNNYIKSMITNYAVNHPERCIV